MTRHPLLAVYVIPWNHRYSISRGSPRLQTVMRIKAVLNYLHVWHMSRWVRSGFPCKATSRITLPGDYLDSVLSVRIQSEWPCMGSSPRLSGYMSPLQFLSTQPQCTSPPYCVTYPSGNVIVVTTAMLCRLQVPNVTQVLK
jgi:hypothetical protein